jgi:hypothetical protein
VGGGCWGCQFGAMGGSSEDDDDSSEGDEDSEYDSDEDDDDDLDLEDALRTRKHASAVVIEEEAEPKIHGRPAPKQVHHEGLCLWPRNRCAAGFRVRR